jgi:hemerythrin superfamily protein
MSDKILKNCTTCSDIDCNKKDVWCLKNKFIKWKSKKYGDKLKAFYKKNR